MTIKITIFVSALVILTSVLLLLRKTDSPDESMGTAPRPMKLQKNTTRTPVPNAEQLQVEQVSDIPVEVTTAQALDPTVSPSEAEQPDSAAAISLPDLSQLLTFEAFQDFLLETNRVDVSKLFTSNVLDQMLTTAGRNETNLIAAHILSGDIAYLEEALGMSPESVLAKALAISKYIAADDPPENLEEWIEHVRETEPDNSISDYWKAYRAFQATDINAALAHFVEAAKKPYFDDRTAVARNALEQFLMESGVSEVPAKAIAFENIVSAYGDQQRLISGLVHQIDEMHIMFTERNQQEDCIALAQHVAVLGERLANSQYRDTLFTDLVGISIERKALEREASLQNETGNTARLTEIDQRLSALDQETLSIKAVVQCPVNINQLLTTCSEAEISEYFDLITSHGEYSAWLWAVENVVNRKTE
jgi:hypothetical protein